MVENSKAPEVEPNSESDKVEGEQGAHRSRGSNVEPNFVRSQSTQLDPSRIDLRPGFRTDLRTGSRTDLEPILPHTQKI